jgi:polysaccharide biosynthesis protein PslH
LNILILCKKVPYPATDGESIVIMSDIQALKSLGHEIFVYCINTKKHFVDTSNYNNLPFWTDFDSEIVDTNSFITLFNSFFSKFPFQLARFYSRDISKKIAAYSQGKKIDIVIYQGLAMTQYQSLFKTMKQHYRVHNLEWKVWDSLAINAKNFLKKHTYSFISNSIKKYERKQLNSIHKFLTLSDEETNAVNQIYADKAVHIPISIDKQISKNYNSENAGLLFIGSLDWLPNLQGLDWFLNTIYPHISHIPVTIAGKGLFDLKNYPNIKLISNFDKIEDLFTSHRLMIVPLLAGAGIRIKILEAMQFGIPIISTPIGAEGIIDSQNSLYIETNSAQWIEKINEIYTNDTQLRKASNDLKENYTLHYSQHKIMELWKSVLTYT